MLGARLGPELPLPGHWDPWAGSFHLNSVSSPAHSPNPSGYADHMGLAQFRRRFQALDPPLLKKILLAPEGVDERKVRAAER